MLLIFCAGCSVYQEFSSFTKQRYINTVAYFNTYYNAQRLFDEAVSDYEKGELAFYEKPLRTLTQRYSASSTAKQKFTASIEKNSKLLSYYPDSKWVDGSLLMIGKAYYFLEEDVRAERKFLELLAQFPNSNLIPEARLFYGRSLLRQKKVSDAMTIFEKLVIDANSQNDDDLQGETAFTMGNYFFQQQQYDKAIQWLTVSVELMPSGLHRAMAAMSLGECYSSLGRYEEAERQFSQVESYSPVYYQTFLSKIKIAQTLRQRQKFEETVEYLYDLESDNKNSEYLSVINFEVANSFRAAGDLAAAMSKYDYIDTAFARTEESAASMYILGSIMENTYGNYDSAKNLYIKSKGESSQSTVYQDASRRAEILQQYFQLHSEIVKYDSLSNNIDTSSIPIDTLAVAKSYKAPLVDSTAAEKRKLSDKAILNMRQKDSVRFVDSAITAIITREKQKKRNLFDSLQRSAAKANFELGGIFFLELQKPDSARLYFQHVLNYPGMADLHPRTLFILAELNASNRDSVYFNRDSLYQRLIEEYPLSEYAQEARKKLNIPLMEKKRDSLELKYEDAEQLLQRSQYLEAINMLKNIHAQAPGSALGIKALYAAGWQYEYALHHRDSAMAVYNRLIALYPQSVYASPIKTKLSVIEAEIKKQEEEKKKESEGEASPIMQRDSVIAPEKLNMNSKLDSLRIRPKR